MLGPSRDSGCLLDPLITASSRHPCFAPLLFSHGCHMFVCVRTALLYTFNTRYLEMYTSLKHTQLLLWSSANQTHTHWLLLNGSLVTSVGLASRPITTRFYFTLTAVGPHYHIGWTSLPQPRDQWIRKLLSPRAEGMRCSWAVYCNQILCVLFLLMYRYRKKDQWIKMPKAKTKPSGSIFQKQRGSGSCP